MKIEKIKKTGSRYKIYLDDNTIINTFDEVIIKNNLLFKKKLDINLISKIHLETSYYDCYNKVINLISKRYRSEYEIKNYLIKNNIENYENIIKELKEKGYINDERFAKAFISDKIHLSNVGKGKIKKELLEHKIDEKIIDKELSLIADDAMEEKIDKIILKKIKNNKKDSSYMLKQKVLNYLLNLGYDKEMIISRINYFNFSSKNSENEFEKILKKLSLKYSGKDLENKLKQKLYSKGYSAEEINDYITKKF